MSVPVTLLFVQNVYIGGYGSPHPGAPKGEKRPTKTRLQRTKRPPNHDAYQTSACLDSRTSTHDFDPTLCPHRCPSPLKRPPCCLAVGKAVAHPMLVVPTMMLPPPLKALCCLAVGKAVAHLMLYVPTMMPPPPLIGPLMPCCRQGCGTSRAICAHNDASSPPQMPFVALL